MEGIRTGPRRRAPRPRVPAFFLPWCLLAVLAVPAGGGRAFAEPAPDAEELCVGVFASPPFAMRGADGDWEGVAVDVWRRVAGRMGLRFRFEPFEFETLKQAVEQRRVDVGVGAISITAKRAEYADFAQPFYLTGLGIAVPRRDLRAISADLIDYLAASNFLVILAVLLVFSLGAGLVIWLAERGRNAQEFQPGFRGLVDGIWWAVVTVTTVGYGEKTPKSVPGRIIGLLWMLMGIVLLALVTAAITSTITINELGYKITGPQDLSRVIVGTVRDTTADIYLARQHIRPRLYPELRDALEDLAAKKIGAVVFDRPILRYYRKFDFQGRIDVLPVKFSEQTYGFVFPLKSALRKPVNVQLLKLLDDEPAWYEGIVHTYMHKDG